METWAQDQTRGPGARQQQDYLISLEFSSEVIMSRMVHNIGGRGDMGMWDSPSLIYPLVHTYLDFWYYIRVSFGQSCLRTKHGMVY